MFLGELRNIRGLYSSGFPEEHKEFMFLEEPPGGI
jgi:hypothetical protein